MRLVCLCGPVLAADLVVNRKNYPSMQPPLRTVDVVSCHGVPKAGMTGQPWRQNLPCLPLAYRT